MAGPSRIQIPVELDKRSVGSFNTEIGKAIADGVKSGVAEGLQSAFGGVDFSTAASKFADSMNNAMSKIDFGKTLNIGDALSGSGSAIEQIVAELNEVKGALQGIHSAISNSSIEDMVGRSTAALGAMVVKLQEVSSLLDSINNKEFSVTNTINNFSKQSGVDKSWFALQTRQATELKNVISQIQTELSGTKTMVKDSMDGDARAIENQIRMYQFPKTLNTQTGVISGIADMNLVLEQGIDYITKYNAKVAEIGNGKIAEIELPDLTRLQEAIKALQEYERYAAGVADGAARVSTTTQPGPAGNTAINGLKDQTAVNESLASIKTLIDEIGVSFDTLRGKVDSAFDFTNAKGALAELKTEVESLSSSLNTMSSAFQRVAKAKIEADERAKIDTQNSLLSSEATDTKRAYDKLLSGGFDESEAGAIKQRYAEWLQAINEVRNANSVASQDAIANLQAEGDAIRRAVSALQEKAKAAAGAAKEQEAASAKAERAAEREAKASQNAAVRELNMRKQSANLQNRVQNYINNNSRAYSMFGAQLDKIMGEISNLGDLSGDDLRQKLSEISAEFANIQTAASAAGASGQTFFQKLKSGYERFGGWALITKSFMAAINLFKQMVGAVKELDAAMTELKKVTDLTASGYQQFYSQAAAAAKSVGASVSDTINATADFARLGYNVPDALRLAEAGLMYKNVGDGINDVSQATESLISTIKAFDLSAEDAMMVVDEFNEVGNNFAISSTGIGDALVRSASALHGAGNSLEESIGLITAANAIVQNPDSVGTAMKTLTMYLRAAKTELDEAGESSEGCAESVSKLRTELMSLTGVDIMLDDNTFKSTYQIVKEISEVWDSLSDTSRANVTSLIAGKRNANVVQALMTNFDDAQNAMESATGAAGSALAENEKYLDSIAGTVSLLQASFEELSQSVVGSDIVKFFVDTIRYITETATALNKVHLLLPLIASSIGAIIGRGLVKDVKTMADSIQAFVRTGASAKDVMSNLGLSISSLSKNQKALLATRLDQIASDPTITDGYRNEIAAIKSLITAESNLASTSKSTGTSIAAMWKALPTGGQIMLIASAVIAVTQLVSQAVTSANEAADQAIEKAREISDNYDEANKSYQDNKNTINGLRDRFNELAKGVDDSGKNVSLTAGEYEEFQGILQQLISISPGIVESYDEQGNAVLRYKDAIKEAIAEQDALNDGARSKYISGGADLMKGAAAAYQKAVTELYNGGDKVLSVFRSGVFDMPKDTEAFSEAVKAAIGVERDYAALTASEMVELYKNREVFIDSLESSGQLDPSEIDKIRLAMNGMSVAYNGMISERKRVTDYLHEYLKEDDWFGTIPINALDEYREGLDGAVSMSDDLNANIESARQFGAEFASAMNSVEVKDIREMAAGLKDGVGDDREELAAYNQAVDDFKASWTGSDAVLTAIVSYFDEISNAAATAAPAIDDTTESVVGLKDALSELKSGSDILSKARADVANDGHLSADTLSSIQQAMKDDENISDYLYTENGVLKLNEEAWKARNRAMLEGDLASYREQLADANSEFSRLLNTSGSKGGIAQDPTKINEWQQRIANLTTMVRMYEEAIRSVDSEEDPLKLDSMMSSLDSVQSNAADAIQAIKDIQNGTLQDMGALIQKYPELLNIQGILDTDSLDEQEAALRAIVDKAEADYDKIIDTQVEALTSARETAAANGEATDSYDAAIANLMKLRQMTLQEIYGEEETVKVKFDLEVESTGMDTVISSIKSSVSEIGLSDEQIKSLEDRYKELPGYFPDKLFEKTTNGIHLNTEALRELESVYESQYNLRLSDELDDLTRQYADLTDEINKTDDAAELANLYGRRSEIGRQIDSVTRLQSEYSALTSTYNAWKKAQSMGEEGDMYDDVADSLENITKLYEEGLIGTNKFRAAVQMMTDQDLSGLSAIDIAAIYEEAYPKMKRYFTEGADGSRTFLEDMNAINEEWAHLNENGEWELNFDSKEVADALGVSTEMVEIMARKLKDYGFDIDMSGFGDGLESYVTDVDKGLDKIEESKEALQRSFQNGDISLGEFTTQWNQLEDARKTLEAMSGTEVDLDSMSLDEAKEKIVELSGAIGELEQAGIEIPITLTGQYEELKKLIKDLEHSWGVEDWNFGDGGTSDGLSGVESKPSGIDTTGMFQDMPRVHDELLEVEAEVKPVVDDSFIDEVTEQVEKDGPVEIPTAPAQEEKRPAFEFVPVANVNYKSISDAGNGVISLVKAAEGVDGAEASVQRLVDAYGQLNTAMDSVRAADVTDSVSVDDAISNLKTAATEFTSAFADLGGKVDVDKIEIDADTQKALATISAMAVPDAEVIFNPNTDAV